MGVEIRGKDTEHVVVSMDGKDVLRLTKSGPEWGESNYYKQSEATKELMAWLRMHWRGEAPYERAAMHMWHIVKLGFFFAAMAVLTILFVSVSFIIWTTPGSEGGPAAIHWQLQHQGIMLGFNGFIAAIYALGSSLCLEGLKDSFR